MTLRTIRQARPESPRILIVRLSAIGDVIHGMPIACALRERFPRACLSWVVEERAAELLRGHEALDELIVLAAGMAEVAAAVWQLRAPAAGMPASTWPWTPKA